MVMKLSRRAWIRTIVYSSLAVSGGAGYLCSKLLEVVRVDVPVKGLAKRLDGLKIGVMSDFHAGAFTTRGEIVRAVEALEREKPDSIALLGDYVDGAYSHSPKNVEKGAYVFDVLQGLRAPLGVYAVLGNHDHWTDAGMVRERLGKLTLVLLDNQSIFLDDGLAVAGVDDYWEGPAYSHKAIGDLSRESTVVLLSHNPDVNLQLGEDDRVRLVISGHTHGGQIRIPVINYAPWIPCSRKYRGASGLIKESESRWTYITKGVGTFFLPVRLACPPDVSVIRLRRA